ncbi:MAG: 2-C-methyl-D-erythritol 2,4-cyclodiphosphate synthase [Akkermansia sp.]
MIALTGLGYDIHRFAEAPRPLMLGGVHIPSSRGLTAIPTRMFCHAIADALLVLLSCRTSATGFAGRSCLQDILPWILWRKPSLIRERGGRIVNVDSSLIAESPAFLLIWHMEL